MKFIVESSPVPIYNRIGAAFTATLQKFGHTVHFIDASGFDESDFINTINNIDIDIYISTNELNYVQKELKSKDGFIFEKIQKKLIFIHHDNIFSAFSSLNYIANKINALERINFRSHHFCIEKSNVTLLKQCGIYNADKINHASEFKSPSDDNSNILGVTFVGHLMSSLNLYPSEAVPGGQHLQVMAWNRFSQSSFSIQPHIKKLVQNEFFLESIAPLPNNNLLATEQFLIAGLNKFSSAFRGELVSTVKNKRIDIFGGDLSYGTINDPLLKINQSNIYYQPATLDYQNTAAIYKKSKISLNISALQFDTAVNNRFFDIIAAGGFVLTDKRSDLEEICDIHNEISFETPEELISKIDFWGNPKNLKKYQEIKEYLHSSFMNKFTYENAIDVIFKKINYSIGK